MKIIIGIVKSAMCVKVVCVEVRALLLYKKKKKTSARTHTHISYINKHIII